MKGQERIWSGSGCEDKIFVLKQLDVKYKGEKKERYGLGKGLL